MLNAEGFRAIANGCTYVHARNDDGKEPLIIPRDTSSKDIILEAINSPKNLTGLWRKDLAKITGFSLPTVDKWCERLVDEELVNRVKKGNKYIYKAIL